MARNKHPEETVQRILDTALRLFLENGYEKTSMQDIVTAANLTKGAVYHHFHSKEDLLEKAIMSFYQKDDWMREIIENKTLSGLEKLRKILGHEIADKEKLTMDRLSHIRLQDPHFFFQCLKRNMKESAPILAQVIEEGNRDGSLSVKLPLQVAELMLVLMNVWIGLYCKGREDFLEKVQVGGEALCALGMPLLDDVLVGALAHYYDHIQ